MATFGTGNVETDVDVTTTNTAGYKWSVSVSNSIDATTAVSTGHLTDNIIITVSTTQAVSITANTSAAITG